MCNFRKLCEEQDCNLRYEKSFESHSKFKDWDYEHNGNVDPKRIIKGLGKEFNFVCSDCGHKYIAFLTRFREAPGCKYCRKSSNLLCEEECNLCFDRSFASNKFVKYWRDDRNPRTVTKSSGINYKFNCPTCEHNIKQKPRNITRFDRLGCIYCSHTELCDNFKEGGDCDFCFNISFMSCDKVSEWVYEDNDKHPREVFKSSTYDAVFKCGACNHKYIYMLNTIFSQNLNCPFCASMRICEDSCDTCFNKSIASHSCIEEWMYDRNEKDPKTVFLGSHEKFWFKCKFCETPYEMAPHKITVGRGCSYCKNKSERECKLIFEKLTGMEFKKVRSNWLKGYELDGYCKDLKIAFEYNGEQHYEYIPTLFHKKGYHMLLLQQIKDELKKRICVKMKIKLIVIPYWIKEREEFIKNEIKNYCDILI